MMDKGFHVGIVGGGIGGLALAQGLKKAGISVALYERDRTPADRLQGYRVHISPKGSVALHDCLPSDLFGVFAATCSVRNEGFRFLSEKMEELLSIKDRGAASAIARHWSASRITLRQVLLSGLDGIVQFDRNFTHYEETAGGPIVLHFAGGSTAACDVLVGADGCNSHVRHQFLPHAQRIDTGAVGIAAKAMLTDENRRRLPGDGARPPQHVHRPARIRRRCASRSRRRRRARACRPFRRRTVRQHHELRVLGLWRPAPRS